MEGPTHRYGEAVTLDRVELSPGAAEQVLALAPRYDGLAVLRDHQAGVMLVLEIVDGVVFSLAQRLYEPVPSAPPNLVLCPSVDTDGLTREQVVERVADVVVNGMAGACLPPSDVH